MIDPRAELEKVIAAEGVRGFARRVNLSPAYVSLCRGEKPMGEGILAALKLEKIVTYRRIK